MRRGLSILAVGLVGAMATACAGGAPNPLACAAIGAAVGGGSGTVVGLKTDRGHDGDRGAAGGAIGAVVGGGLGYVICAALQEEPAPPPPPPAKATPPPPMKEKIVLRGVNFDFDKSNIRKDAQVILDEAASILNKNADVAVSVEGHTDAVGSDAYNQKLSDRRSNSVKSYLVGKGVSAGRLSTKGWGESKPVASNQTKDGRAMNRRVELLVK